MKNLGVCIFDRERVSRTVLQENCCCWESYIMTLLLDFILSVNSMKRSEVLISSKVLKKLINILIYVASHDKS